MISLSHWFRKMLACSPPAALRKAGVLGINRRNACYTLIHNERRLYPRVDNKLLTKTICLAHGIRVPETFGVFRSQGDVPKLQGFVDKTESFVLKPARGSGGRGILVIRSHGNGEFIKPNGQTLSLAEMNHHISTTLSGLYSLGARPDQVMAEQRIVCHPAFESVAVGGTPDIRIIVFQGQPVMAMVRLPTRASRGRANLHQGAVAAGIDLETGKSFGGVMRNHSIAHHPDTGAAIDDVTVPCWQELHSSASKLAKALELGYVGVDFVVDAELGPVVLEANARPGLAIQIANQAGLLPRLG